MLARVRRTLVERRLVELDSRVLVACSGGPDSVGLVHALSVLAPELGFAVEVASVDHGLRVEAADEVRAVGRFAEGLGLAFHPIRVDVPDGASVQAAAREARYRALREVASDRSCDRIAVGHTRDDQAETVLARLFRGAGVEGLSGVKPRREDGVIRPLLDCTRGDVIAYLARHSLSFVEDPSNRDERYGRVRIRREILPRLEVEDPQVRVHLAELADDAREIAELIDSLADARLAALGLLETLEERISLEVDALGEAPVALRRAVLRRLCERVVARRLGRSHVADVEALLHREGTVWLPRGGVVTREGPRIVVTRSTQRQTESRRRNP